MDNYLTPLRVAEKLQVQKQTILRYIRAKKLRAVRLGRGYRISETDLNDFIKKHQTI